VSAVDTVSDQSVSIITLDDLMWSADQAPYGAKDSGRNRVAV
jgi:hypothetical protein